MLFRFDLPSSFNRDDLEIVLKTDNKPESPLECYGYNDKLNV